MPGMKSFRKELWFNLPTRRGFINITPQVEEALHESGIREGLALVNAMHITASVFINDDEHGLHQDYEKWLENLAPHEPVSQYRHNDTGEDNADAHMKRQVTPALALRASAVQVWDAKWWSLSLTLSLISVRGSKSFTANSTDAAASVCW